MEKNNNVYSVLPIVFAYILWGSLPVYWKAIGNFNAAFVFSARVITTCVFMFFMLLFKGRIKTLYRGKRQLLAIMLAGIMVGLNWYIYLYAIASNQILEAGLAYYMAPIMTIAAGTVVLREKKTKLEYAAIALMFIGVLYQTLTLGRPPVLALSIAFTWTVYTFLKKLTPYQGLESLFLETAIIFIPVLFLGKGSMPKESQPIVKWILLLFSGVATSVPLYLYAKSVKKLPISTVGLIQFLTPIMAVSIGIFVYKEKMSFDKIITFAFIISAVALYCVSLFIKNYKIEKTALDGK